MTPRRGGIRRRAAAACRPGAARRRRDVAGWMPPSKVPKLLWGAAPSRSLQEDWEPPGGQAQPPDRVSRRGASGYAPAPAPRSRLPPCSRAGTGSSRLRRRACHGGGPPRRDARGARSFLARVAVRRFPTRGHDFGCRNCCVRITLQPVGVRGTRARAVHRISIPTGSL